MKLVASGLFFSFIVVSIFSCVNKKKSTDADTPFIDTNVVLIIDTNVVKPLEYYKRFEGSIAGQPVLLQMSSLNNSISGIYYYENIGTPFYFSAQTIAGDSLILLEHPITGKYSEKEKYSNMKLRMTDSTLSGIWQSADRIRSFPVFLTESYPEGSYRFSINSIEDSLKPYPNLINGPFAIAKITFIVPDANIEKEKSNFLKGEIAALMGYDKISTSNSLEDVANKAISDYFFRFKKGLPSPADTSIDLRATSFKNEYDQKIGVVFNRDNIVILSSYAYDFSGGAHPNSSTTFFCIDVENKKRLALSDVLISDSAKISPILERIYRKERRIPTSEKLNNTLFENYILPNENFYFNRMGIVFFYNQYEIAPYSYGTTEIFVPFADLMPYLKTGFKERFFSKK